MGAGASRQQRRRRRPSMLAENPRPRPLPTETVSTAGKRLEILGQYNNVSSASDATPHSRRREWGSGDTGGRSSELEDDMQRLGSLQDGHVGPCEQVFHDALVNAAHQLRARQHDSCASISKVEVEALMLLTRELENLKQMMKCSVFTVEGTWKILEKEGMVERFGQQLYDELLTQNPRLRVHFYGVNLEEQSNALLRMVGTAVHFYEKPQVTVEMLTKAGARHRGYGVNGKIFVEMRDAFFKVFPKFVGTDVFQASEEEWQKFWKRVLDLMMKGSESPEGERYGKVYEEQTRSKIQSDFKLISMRQRECDTRHQFISVMYGKAIDLYGDLSKFEVLKDLRARERVFESLVDLISNIHDKKYSQEYMRELGRRYTVYNVTVEGLQSFAEPFLFTCRHFLEDEWDAAVESRFLWLFEYIVVGVSAGMSSDIKTAEDLRAASSSVSFGLIVTDIEAKTTLWRTQPEAMSLAVKNYQAIVRHLIAEYGAYEVKAVDDSFTIVTTDVLVAVKLSLSIQLELMRMAPVAEGFSMVGDTEGRGDARAWDDHTLRVRIGVEHCTDARAAYDPVHRRYEYYGRSVNRGACIGSAASGGQILLSRESYQHLKCIPEFRGEPCPHSLRSIELTNSSPTTDSRGLDHFIAVSDAGLVSFKGLGESVHLVSLVPRCLAGRQFVERVANASP
ncbi:hypothetical protein LSCM1_03020 [Leishmania martiniquensis]|uniref:Guanylate cyclase domain-containing protein n=1 Tax=Leishmania martiniquensis TaxID=1580590 RepID=A0A836GUM8_9TRYP|nr:hypothetical protein LSCM1_03020 [Leishmania martiniquensis]